MIAIVKPYLHSCMDEMTKNGLESIHVREVMAVPEIAFILKEEVYNNEDLKWFPYWQNVMKEVGQMGAEVLVLDLKSFQTSSRRWGWKVYSTSNT